MGSIIQQIQFMYDQKLYTNVIKIADLILTTIDQKPDANWLPQMKMQLIVYSADSLYHTKQFMQAERLYRQLVQLRYSTVKRKSVSSNNKIECEQLNDVDIKYKIHLCCVALRQNQAAINILQDIPTRLRTSKIYMALGNLYRDGGLNRPAVTCYKEVVRECPLALDAAENLLKLGFQGNEVNTIMEKVTSDISWLNLWLKAQAQQQSNDFTNAIQTYKSLDCHGLLKDNCSILVNMAYCYHNTAQDDDAIFILQRAMRLDANLLCGRDLLANLLGSSTKKEHINYLESLASTNTLDMSLWHSEHWVVLGYFMYATKKYERAAYFGQQALSVGHNVEALLLKAKTFMEIAKYTEAGNHCIEGLKYAPHRYEFYECLVHSYLKRNRYAKADAIAVTACKELNYSPLSLTLHASVLLKDPMASTKTVKRMLEEAHTQDRTFSSDAVYMLAEYLQDEMHYEQASELLLKYVDYHPTSRLHQMLGVCFTNLDKDDEAFTHYNIALKLDPNNQRALESLNMMGRSTTVLLSKPDSYYTCVGGETSEVTVATDTREADADGSDTDQWPN